MRMGVGVAVTCVAAIGAASGTAGCDGRSMRDIEQRVAEVHAARKVEADAPVEIHTRAVATPPAAAAAATPAPSPMIARQRQLLERIFQWSDRRAGAPAGPEQPTVTLDEAEARIRARLDRLVKAMRMQVGNDVNRTRIYLMRWFPGLLPVQLGERKYLARVTARYPDGEDPPVAEFDIEFLDDLTEPGAGDGR